MPTLLLQNVCKLLLEKRVQGEAQDAFGQTAMFEAVRNGHDSIISMLRAHGVRCGSPGHFGPPNVARSQALALKTGHQGPALRASL